MPGLMDRALARFPDDPALRLERGLAAAGRFNVIVDGGRLAEHPAAPASGRGGFRPCPSVSIPNAAPACWPRSWTIRSSGRRRGLRLGYLHWTLGRDEAARDELTKAAERTADADVRYLAQFLLGWIAIKRGDNAAAIPRLEAALAARPGSQSAAVALAALELQRGDADKAHDIARASLDQRRSDVDPWRLFLYGHHPRWPARLAELRRAVKP